MSRVLCLTTFLVLLVLATPAAAEDERPVRISDISRMVASGMSPDEVLVVVRDRGADFRLTPSAIRRLEGWGFTERQVDLARRLVAGEDVVLPGDAPDGHGEGGADPSVRLPTEFPIGYAKSEQEIAAQQTRIARAIQNARLGYEAYAFERFTLYCSRRRAEQLVPALRELERDIVARFPESIANGTDPRTAVLILTDHGRDFRTMLESIVASYRVDWPTMARDWDWRQIESWTYWVSGSVTLVDGGAFNDREGAMRYLSFGLGYMMMSHIGTDRVAGALAAGFGNVIEVMAEGSPSVTLDPYFGDNQDVIEDWSGYVRRLIADQKMPSMSDVMGYERVRMERTHCTHAWAMTAFLSAQPDALFRAVYTCRGQETTTFDAVLEAYGVEQAPFQQAWLRAIARQR